VTARERADGDARGRHSGDVVRLVAGAVVLAVSVLAVQRDHLTVFERNLFRLLNDLPSALEPVLAAVMQAGNLAAGPALAAVALFAGRHRLAGRLLVAGPVAWILAKVVKDLIQRPRPTGFLEQVARFEGTGLGFVSGHTAVAAALATAATPYLPRRVQRVVWAVAWVVGLARIYVGAHLPLDVIGGAALGWMVGAGLHLLLGAPHRRPTLDEARRALARIGWTADMVARAGVRPIGSFPFVARGSLGVRFIKLLDPEPRDRDLLPRLARFLLRRDVRDEVAMGDTRSQAEHEVAMTLLARQAGCRVPAVLGLHHNGDRTWVVEEYAGATTLDHLADLDDDLLRATWAQVATLHAGGIVHRDLVAANVVVDEARNPWLVDLAHADTSERDRPRHNDVAELLASTALLVGSERAIRTATDVLGQEPVRAAAAELRPLTLTAPTRSALRSQPGLLKELRRGVLGPDHPWGREAAPPRWTRRGFVAVGLAGVGSVVVTAGANDVAGSLWAGPWRWYGLLVLAAVAAGMLGGGLVAIASGHGLALGRTALLAVESSVSAVAIGESPDTTVARGLRRSGLTVNEARTTAPVVRYARFTAAVLCLIAAVVWTATDDVGWSTPTRWVPSTVAAAALAVALGALLLAPAARRGPEPGPCRGTVQETGWWASAWRTAMLLPAAMAEMAASLVVLAAAEHAVGGDAAVALVVLTGAVGAVIGRVMRGGPGLVEVAMVLVLSGGLGVAPAAAAVLVTRLATFWIPALAFFAARREWSGTEGPAARVDDAPAPSAAAARAGRGRVRAWLRPVLSVTVVVVAFLGVLPRIASYGDAWRQLAGVHPVDLAVLAALAAWNLMSYWPLLMLGLPGLTVRQAAISSQVGTAVSNTVPAGSAFGAGITVAMYRRWGFGAAVIASALVVTGAWNAGSKLVLAAVAVAVAPEGASFAPPALGLSSIGLLAIGAVLAAAILRGPVRAGRTVGWLERSTSTVRRRADRLASPGWAASFERFREESGELIARRWPALTVAAVVSHLSLFAVFAAALEAVGVDGVSLMESFAVLAVIRAALIVPITPGGAGLAEIGLAGLLVVAGAEEAAAVAAVLLFRAVTWLLPIVVGAGCGLLWLAEQRSGRRLERWTAPT
jgi:glycosyltransferase 2 family protein